MSSPRSIPFLNSFLPSSGIIAPLPNSWRRYCRSSRAKTGIESAVEDESKKEEKLPQPIRCRQCGHAITAVEERFSQNGSFSHTFFNPAGIVFELGCFRRASGCRVAGPPTDEFTWFPGYFWRFALCRGCQAHLGWQYTNTAGAAFFGLILNRLQEG